MSTITNVRSVPGYCKDVADSNFSVEVGDKLTGADFLKQIAAKTAHAVEEQFVTIYEMKDAKPVENTEGYLYTNSLAQTEFIKYKNMKIRLDQFIEPTIVVKLN